jgi:tRNA pseudouridine32 synthase/23S rRNA pseudouridine746 synthase
MISEKPYLWNFSEDVDFERLAGTGFTDPFRYVPDPLAVHAGQMIISRLAEWASMAEGTPERALERSFAEGKMLGVLVCRTGFLAAFSGTVKGPDGNVTASVDGFVPPIIDLTEKKGHFKRKEAVISLLNKEIETILSSPEYNGLKKELLDASSARDTEIENLQNRTRFAKMQRDEIRSETADPSKLDELIRESQFQKAELKRCKDRWKAHISGIEGRLSEFEETIHELKTRRAEKSDALQKWIFENAIVHNGAGEASSIWDIFSAGGLVPPGGTGECAAPKLLNYAFAHGLEPLAMGEFWYGASPDTAVRTHGHFYPSCTSKCGPLLAYMTKGLRSPVEPGMTAIYPTIPSVTKESGVTLKSEATETSLPTTIGNLYEDDSIIVVEKPSGMPSVPGLDGRTSLQEHLEARSSHHQDSSGTHVSIHAVHRLDMDTSGVMVFAKTAEAAVNMRRQFEEHTIRKTYMARVSAGTDIPSKTGKGVIDLPLSPDYDERPRQKVDFTQGKPAHTEYETIRTNEDGTSDILLYPYTGRTHQLRVHCAHHLGLGRPIVGDLLYGGHSVYECNSGNCMETNTKVLPERLCLHALSITFLHPETGQELTFTSDRLSY